MKKQNLIVGGIIIAILAGGVLVYKKMNPVDSSGIKSISGAKTKGPENAPVTIVEYSDFQCPACGAAQPMVHDLMKKYPDKIKVVYRHFPLKQHMWAPLAHQAAECAGEQNKFWEFHDWLFQTQSVWSIPANPLDGFLSQAKNMGLNLDTFGVCLTSEEVKGRIQHDRAQGDALQISSTPTFFINGDRVVGPNELKTMGDIKIRAILGLPAEAVPQTAHSAGDVPVAPQ